MTKAVRIENADHAPYMVEVQVWEKAYGSQGAAPDQMVSRHELRNPTDMTSGMYVTSTRYLVIKELPLPMVQPAP